jgi:rubredoxin
MFFQINYNRSIYFLAIAATTTTPPANTLHPKAYIDEPDIAKIKIILNWMKQQKIDEILSGKEVIQNITVHLFSMQHNGYLRILHDVDMNLIKVYLSETSRILFEQFKQDHLSDGWICPMCTKHFGLSDSKWKCSKCLYVYHNSCAIGHAFDNVDNTIYLLCSSCAFLN